MKSHENKGLPHEEVHKSHWAMLRNTKGWPHLAFALFIALIIILASTPAIADDEDNDGWWDWGEVCDGGGGIIYVCNGPGCVQRIETITDYIPPAPTIPENPFPEPDGPGGTEPPGEEDGGGGDIPNPFNPTKRLPAYEGRQCGSQCFGACGANCDDQHGNRRNVITEICDRKTGIVKRSVYYVSGVHQGCIDHDNCYDDCLAKHGCEGEWTPGSALNLCMHGAVAPFEGLSCDLQPSCDQKAICEHGLVKTTNWLTGGGPYEEFWRFDLEETSGWEGWCAGGLSPHSPSGGNPSIGHPPIFEMANCQWKSQSYIYKIEKGKQILIGANWECK